jgi:DNA uptake protein ComE-like DNA-binding protein
MAVLATVFVPAVMSAAEPSAQASTAPKTSPAVSSQSPAAAPSSTPHATSGAPAGTASPTVKSAAPHAATPSAAPGAKPAQAPKAPPKPEKKVDLNNASLAELQKLPTMTEAEAKKIIANRPYGSKGELLTKAGLPLGVYQAIRYKVELQKPRAAAPKK